VDSGVADGGEISVHYDPMVAKLIASGETREAARRRAIQALQSYPILGIVTNVPFLLAILEHPRFVAGDLDTHFLDTEGEALRASLDGDVPPEALAVAQAARDAGRPGTPAAPRANDPWSALRDWRG
jgi:acetyl/propionyl-CoA carboxylase alpha subunit